MTPLDRVVIGRASRPREGERLNGDAVVVRREGPRMLFAVIDALGHGEQAHIAASRAVERLEQTDMTLPVDEQMRRLHLALRNSRGAAVTLGATDGVSLTLVGVGNVELRSRPDNLSFVSTPGIVGVVMRRVRMVRAKLERPLRLFIFSDGISRRADIEAVDKLAPPEAAVALLDRHGKRDDDASILCLSIG
jgi:negative regulator of sigma-B (phosphoserine phosphatase)